MRGREIRITPDKFVQMFGLYTRYELVDPVGAEVIDEEILMEDVPRGKIIVKTKWLKPEYVDLSKSVCSKVMPTIHDKEYDTERMLVIWAVASEIRINISRTMVLQIVNGATTKNKRIAFHFPGIITEIRRG